MKLKIFFWLLAAIICLSSSSLAAIPSLINYQGKLTDSTGANVPDAVYTIQFSIYDVSSGGTALWFETIPIQVTKGVFNHILGSSVALPSSTFSGTDRWLGIKINLDTEMTPRQRITSNAYNFKTLNADTTTVALDLTCISCVGTSDINATQVQRRVTGTAPVGEYITAINEDGSVVTAVDQAGAASGWTDDGSVVRLSTNTDDAGIGTASPGAKLQIDALTNVKKGLIIRGGSSGVANLQEWQTFGGTAASIVDASGRFGIGTTSPFARLGVESNTGTEVGIRVRAAATQTAFLQEWQDNAGTALASVTATGIFNGSGALLTNLNASNIATGTLGIARMPIGGNWSLSSNLRFDDSTLVVDPLNDRIGLGTSTPLGLLHLKGNNYKLLLESSGNADVVIGRADTTRYGNFILANGDPSQSVNNRWAIGLRNGDSKLHLYSEVNSSNVMVLEPGGNVGIGTTSPAKKLDVAGSIKGDTLFSSVLSSNSPLSLQAPAGTTRMHIDDVTGSVGIGTTLPSATLHIYRSGFPSLAWDDAGATVWTFTHDGSNLNLNVGGGTSARLTAGGNAHFGIIGGRVGIATESPLARLDVHSTSAGDATVAEINREANDGILVRFSRGGVTNVGNIAVVGGVVSYNAFTGSHYGWTEEALQRGELVTLTGRNRNSHDNPEAEVIYGIKRSIVPNDPACLGSYLGLQESGKPASPENPYLIMAVGNGDMWVVDEGENIQPGEYLISSSTPGHAMKDDQEKFLIGHVVARAAESVDWSTVSETINGHKHKKISVLFGNFVRSNATVLNRTIEEQQTQIENLERRMLKLEAGMLRSQTEN